MREKKRTRGKGKRGKGTEYFLKKRNKECEWEIALKGGSNSCFPRMWEGRRRGKQSRHPKGKRKIKKKKTQQTAA